MSTRSFDDLVAALGSAPGISKSEVSRICAGLDEVVTVFRIRRVDHIAFPYVYLDTTCLHVRNPRSYRWPWWPPGCADGDREILGLDVGDSRRDCEGEVSWRAFLAGLKKRGLTGARLVVSANAPGWSPP